MTTETQKQKGQASGIGARVVDLRKRRVLTQRELAEKAGIHPIQLSRIENGHDNPRPQSLRSLAAALDVPVERITGRRV